MADALRDRAGLCPDEHDDLLVLSGLIEGYEDEHHPISAASEVPMLRYLIEANGLAQARVTAGAGIAESTLSEILAGRLKFRVKHIAMLAGYFKVDPGLFIPA